MDIESEAQKILKITQIEQHLKFHYEPCMDIVKAALCLTSEEIYQRLQDLFPSDLYGKSDVINILSKLCFRMFDMGEMNFVWAMDYGN